MTLSSSQGDLTKMTAPARPMFRPVPQAKNRTLYGTRRLALWVRSLSATSAELARRLWTGSPLARPGALPLAGPGAIPPTLLQSACRHLCVDDEQGLKDLLAATVLSECVYKIQDTDSEGVLRTLRELNGTLPPSLASLERACWAGAHVRHRFMVAESSTTFFVAFMGTKVAADYLTNVNLGKATLDLDDALWSPVAEVAAPRGCRAGCGAGAPRPRRRPRCTAASWTARGACPWRRCTATRARGKRLVLCGHSLGGAVAAISALRLMGRLPRAEAEAVSCFAFAMPAVANATLSRISREAGLDGRIRNYLMPEDPIPRLLTSRAARVRPPQAGAAEPGRGRGRGRARRARPARPAGQHGGRGRARLLARPLSAAASAPLRVAQDFCPVGTQLYITPGRVIPADGGAVETAALRAQAEALRGERLPDATDSPWAGRAGGRRRHRLGARATSRRRPRTRPPRAWTAWRPRGRRAAAAAGIAVTTGSSALALAGRVSGTLANRLRWRSLAEEELAEEEDNADVAAAEDVAAAARLVEGAAAGARTPQARLFPAHRMHLHRSRILDIARGVLGVHAHATGPRAALVRSVEQSLELAPPVESARATASLSVVDPPEQAADAARAAGGWLGPRGMLRADRAGVKPQGKLKLQVCVRGRGLDNVRSAAILGLPRDRHAVSRPGKAPATTVLAAAGDDAADALPLEIHEAARGEPLEELVASITLTSTTDIASLLSAARDCLLGSGPRLAVRLRSDLVDCVAELQLTTGLEPKDAPAAEPEEEILERNPQGMLRASL
ncbi:hypothetical protein QBZ16_004852 [Prototheca wickerhamii]|uniref:Fungal lipase-type domain-containing protein n=1 Tax=Prototheca wickerhamii TaxID=3111 RepID=A0AAD9IGI1_PROWI|nr:hypothetical protein QBZ16_004852 [Prototheca wickerhamii]